MSLQGRLRPGTDDAPMSSFHDIRPRWLASSVAVSALVSLLACATVSSIPGCAGASRVPDAQRHASDDDTTVGTGDLFDVRVYGEDDLSAQYRIAQDGSIDFPLIGRIEVTGLEPGAIATLISTRLRDGHFLVQPHVSVVVREYNSKRISILGAVRNPGSYPIRSGMGVVEAIGLAGGFTALANRDGTIITRTVDEHLHSYSAPIDRISTGQEADVPVRSGDIVRVPERMF
jgi:protein involved in polysaccharide export with SLBB domain